MKAVRGLGVLVCVGVVAVVTAGCGGGSGDESTAVQETTTLATGDFTTTQVEKLITRTIKPSIAANLGEGHTIRVDCKVAEPGFRCVYRAFSPDGKPVKDQRVIYAVTCDPKCSWIPIG